jgi:hypothetical protein
MNFKQQTNTQEEETSLIFSRAFLGVAALSHPTTKTPVFFVTKLNIITSNAHSPNNKNRKEENKQTNHYNTCIPKRKNTRSSTKITLLSTTRHERGKGEGGGEEDKNNNNNNKPSVELLAAAAAAAATATTTTTWLLVKGKAEV